MHTVLVTGGAGYIGSQTCKTLSQAGLLPVTYDDLSTGHRESVKWGPFVLGDLADKQKLAEAFIKYRPIGVLHFAAKAIISESMANPGKYYATNTAGTLSLLETMRDCKIQNIVFSSTCATYGNPQFSPITELHPQDPINPYGRSKLMAEQILRDFADIHGIHNICLRYFNAAGADFDGEIGESHFPETHIIPSMMEVAMGKRKELVIYGNDFPTLDGSAVRDYVHVADLAQAHLHSLQWLLTHKKSDFFNLGTGKGHSILEILQAIKVLTGRDIPFRYENRRIGDPPHLVADNTKAKKLLRWSPASSTLPLIIESAWNWHSKMAYTLL